MIGGFFGEEGVAGEHEELPLLRHVLQNLEGGPAAGLVPVYEHLVEEDGQALAVGVEVVDDGEAKRRSDSFMPRRSDPDVRE